MGYFFPVAVQPGDMPQRERQIHARLAIRREKGTVLVGVLVNAQGYMEGLLDVRHRAVTLKSLSSREPLNMSKPLAFAKFTIASQSCQWGQTGQ